jgi:hypothetical protein
MPDMTCLDRAGIRSVLRGILPLARDRPARHGAYVFPNKARFAGRRCATGYEKKNGRFAQSEHRLDGICGSGSIYSTAADLCRYDAALATNRLVSAATMRTALTSGVRHNGTPISARADDASAKFRSAQARCGRDAAQVASNASKNGGAA